MGAQEIYPGLWQGSWPVPGTWLAEKGFSTLVLCAFEYQPPRTYPPHVEMIVGMREANPWPGVEVIYAPNDDNPYEPPSREQLRTAVQAGRIVAERLKEKKKVLTTCWQGRNRSGLVSALGLFFLGIPATTAVKIVQTRRDNGLRNPQFIAALSNLRQPPVTGHLHQTVAAKPPLKQPNLQAVPTFRAPKARFPPPPRVF